MLTRLKLLRLQREMMETREKKMMETREKKMMEMREKKRMVDSREKKMMSMREKKKKETKFISASRIKGNEATSKGRTARHQEGYFGNSSLILIELNQNNLQRESQRIKKSICQ